VAAIGAEELDLLVPQLLGMTIKLTFALRAGHPKNFSHDCFLTKSEIRSTESETNSKSINLNSENSKQF
jgi:hypothetical protein